METVLAKAPLVPLPAAPVPVAAGALLPVPVALVVAIPDLVVLEAEPPADLGVAEGEGAEA